MSNVTAMPLNSAPLDRRKLINWVEAYKDSISHKEKETKSFLISLPVLKDFIKDIDNVNNDPNHTEPIEAVRFYLIRSEEVQCGYNTFAKILSDKTRQLGLAIVPATAFRNPDHEVHHVLAKDCTRDTPLPWIVPGYTNEHSGLCPTNCADTI